MRSGVQQNSEIKRKAKRPTGIGLFWLLLLLSAAGVSTLTAGVYLQVRFNAQIDDLLSPYPKAPKPQPKAPPPPPVNWNG